MYDVTLLPWLPRTFKLGRTTKYLIHLCIKMEIPTAQPIFKLELNHKVIPGILTIAKFDGIFPCLTASAGYDKIIIHHPYSGGVSSRAMRSKAHGEVSELNLSQAVVALAAGPIKPNCNRDMLLIGSPSQILAYDVHDNADLFYKDTPDGVNVVVTGSLGKHENLCVVGGNSSVIALDWEGAEVYWNTVSGKVNTILLHDFDRDGENELILGCEDSFIRVMKNNQLIAEIAETGPVLCLSPISDTRFSYGLGNGTIGVYDDRIRLWRVKSKQNVISLQWSGESLACCWSNGRVDYRDVNSGKVIGRIQMKSNGAAMLMADYRSVGTPDLICISVKGEVLGFIPHSNTTSKTAGFKGAVKKLPTEADRIAITELFNRKQSVLMELQHYESNASAGNCSQDSLEKSSSLMPINTKLQVTVNAVPEGDCLDLFVTTDNETIVRAALILAEGIFESGETLVSHPSVHPLSSHLTIQLVPPRDVPIDVHIKALVGYSDSEQFHIFELTKQLPRFAMYCLARTSFSASKQEHYTTFHIKERIQRICLWVNQNFLLEEEYQTLEDVKRLEISFICLRNNNKLDLSFLPDGQVKIFTKDIKLAGDIIQSLANFLNLTDLQVTAHFPDVENQLRQEMDSVSQVGEMRSRLAAEAAERAQLITALLPAAHDASATYDWNVMISRYKDVMLLNEELIAGCHIRRATQEQAVTSLKILHTILQQAARLRVGKYSNAVVTASRKAVKENNIEALIKVIQVGDY